MNKTFSWTVNYDLDVDFEDIYKIQNSLKSSKYCYSDEAAVYNFFCDQDTEIFFGKTEKIFNEVVAEFQQWKKEKGV